MLAIAVVRHSRCCLPLSALIKVLKVLKVLKVVTRVRRYCGQQLEPSLLLTHSVHAFGESAFGEEVFLQSL